MQELGGWEARAEARADRVLAGEVPSPDPHGGMIAIGPVDLSGIGRHEEGRAAPARRPMLLVRRSWRDAGDVWVVVPLTTDPAGALPLFDAIETFDGSRARGQLLEPRLVLLHPTAVRRSAVVGWISDRDRDRVADAIDAGSFEDLTAVTGLDRVRLGGVRAGETWNADATLLELRRRRVSGPDRDTPDDPPAGHLLRAPSSPWQLTRDGRKPRRTTRRRPNRSLRHGR